MNRYKVTGPRPVHGAAPGDVLEHDFTAEEERDLVASGRLCIEPRPYRVVGTSRVHDTDPGGTFTAALPVGVEAALVAGGHVERVPDSTPKAQRPAKVDAPAKTDDVKE